MIPPSYHPLGLELVAVMELPEGSGPFPGCVILHGSGGLFREDAYGEPCTEEVEGNYALLKELLLGQQIGVILPSSFYSRDERFCEDNSEYIDFAPDDYDREKRRVAHRTYDLLATANFFCDQPEVDCDRLCFTGTSNGGSILFHYIHRHLDATFATFFEDDAADLTPIPYVPLPEDRPLPRFAQAISPGCGLRGAIGLESDEGDLPAEPIEDLYYPAVPLYLNIGDDDSVPDECTTEVPGFAGTRQIQVTEVEAREAIAPEDSLYHVEVHAGGEHDLLGGPYGDAIRASLLQRAKDAFE